MEKVTTAPGPSLWRRGVHPYRPRPQQPCYERHDLQRAGDPRDLYPMRGIRSTTQLCPSQPLPPHCPHNHGPSWRRCGNAIDRQSRQLGTRAQAKLAIDPPAVAFHRAHADEQRRCDFGVGAAGSDQFRNASFGHRQGEVPAGPSPEPTEFGERPCGIDWGAQPLECFERACQLEPRFAAVAGASQHRAEPETSACLFGGIL